MTILNHAHAKKQSVIKNTAHVMQQAENARDNVHVTSAQTAMKYTMSR